MCQAAVFCPRESSGPSLEPAGALGCLLHFSQIIPDSYWSPIHEEWKNVMALGSSEWHSVYWEMISELPDRITLYSLFKLVMEDDQMRECLARRNKAIDYIRCIYKCLSNNAVTVSHVKKLIWHEAGFLVAVGQGLTFYLHLYSLCVYLLPAVPQLEKRLDRGHLALKDFSHFHSIEKSSSPNAVLFFWPSPAERLQALVCAGVRGYVCVCVCSLIICDTQSQTFAFEGIYWKQDFPCSSELRVCFVEEGNMLPNPLKSHLVE